MLTSGFSDNILNILAILAIYFGISVIINNNPVISILYLIGLIASIGSYLISEGFSFLGLSYLIIYIGAVYLFVLEMYYFLSTPYLLVLNRFFYNLLIINNLVFILFYTYISCAELRSWWTAAQARLDLYMYKKGRKLEAADSSFISSSFRLPGGKESGNAAPLISKAGR